MDTYDTFAEAKAAAGDSGSPSGTYRTDGKTPVYFVAPKDATDEDMRRLAFEAKNGRPMTSFERDLLQLAEAGVR